MNINNCENSHKNKNIFKEYGYQEGWDNRFLTNIHSGVRVKIQSKVPSSNNQTNNVQKILKRLWFESEASALSQNGQKLAQPLANSIPSPCKTSHINHRNISINLPQKTKHHIKSIGVQTTVINKIDRQISCDILTSETTTVEQSSHSRSSSSLSSISNSNTSVLEKTSIQTDHTTTETSFTSKTTEDSTHDNDGYARYRSNKHRNNNATDVNAEENNNKESDTQNLTHNKENKHTEQYSQSIPLLASSKYKSRLLSIVSNIFSLFGLSSLKHERVSKSTNVIENPLRNNNNQINVNQNFRTTLSRCRRSTRRYTKQNNPIEQKNLTKKQTPLSTNDNKVLPMKYNKHTVFKVKHSNEMNRNKSFHRKTSSMTRHHRHRTKPILNRSSRSKKRNIQSCPIKKRQLKTFDKQKFDENVEHQQNNLSLKTEELIPRKKEVSICKSASSHSCSKIQNENYISSSTDIANLRVKNKDLILDRLNSKTSIVSFDNSIERHRTNMINEFKSILNQTKLLDINQNSSDRKSSSVKHQSQNKVFRNSTKLEDQNEIIQESVNQLKRYQKFAKQYKLQSNKIIQQFLMKSVALSSESLQKLSLTNQPYTTQKFSQTTKQI